MVSSPSPMVPILVLLFALFSRTIESHSQANNANPFGFIRNLQRSKKGQIVDGLPRLRNYLAKFGYLDHLDYASEANLVSSQVFDENLESAIKTYQLYHNLPATGYLDTNTVEQMIKPRCGFPDMINGTNIMHSRKHFINGTSLYAFIGTVWPKAKYKLTYRYLSNTGVSRAENMESVIKEALGRWAKVSKFRFRAVSEDSESDLVFAFYSGDHGDGIPFDGNGGVLAHAFNPQDGRAHFDADEYWSSNPRSNEMDLASVVTHEIGHLLGLAHSSDTKAVMYKSIGFGQIKRDLTPDDIKGIQALYETN